VRARNHPLGYAESGCGIGGHDHQRLIGVFPPPRCVLRYGHASVDRALCLPMAWTGNPKRVTLRDILELS